MEPMGPKPARRLCKRSVKFTPNFLRFYPRGVCRPILPITNGTSTPPTRRQATAAAAAAMTAGDFDAERLPDGVKFKFASLLGGWSIPIAAKLVTELLNIHAMYSRKTSSDRVQVTAAV
jgi:hypothetical protein